MLVFTFEVKKGAEVVENLVQLIGLTALNVERSGLSIFSRVACKASLCLIGVGGLSLELDLSSLLLCLTE